MIYLNIIITVSDINVTHCAVSKYLICHLTAHSFLKRQHNSDNNLNKKNLLSISKKNLDNKEEDEGSSSSDSQGRAYKTVSLVSERKSKVIITVTVQK